MLELAPGVVDPDRPPPGLGEQDRPLRRSAPELEDVLPGHVSQDPELALGELPEPPAGLRATDVLTVRLLVGVGLAIPERAIALEVRQARSRRTRARSHAPPTRAHRSRARDSPAWRARGRHGSCRASRRRGSSPPWSSSPPGSHLHLRGREPASATT